MYNLHVPFSQRYIPSVFMATICCQHNVQQALSPSCRLLFFFALSGIGSSFSIQLMIVPKRRISCCAEIFFRHSYTYPNRVKPERQISCAWYRLVIEEGLKTARNAINLVISRFSGTHQGAALLVPFSLASVHLH